MLFYYGVVVLIALKLVNSPWCVVAGVKPW